MIRYKKQARRILKLKAGDLVKRKGETWLAIILGIKQAFSIEKKTHGNITEYVDIMWCDSGEAFGDCESVISTAFDLISEI